jgi:hypothetical protein
VKDERELGGRGGVVFDRDKEDVGSRLSIRRGCEAGYWLDCLFLIEGLEAGKGDD